MKAVAVADKIWWVGVNDRTTHLFENLWTLPKGVSYNSYLIDDEKTALIDGVKAEFFGEYLERINSILGGRPLDYLIVNHVEPDHSGAIRMLRQVYPNLTIVSNKQALTFISQFYGESAQCVEVKDGDTLSLGEHTLAFAAIPMVHWPETMVSFETKSGILFSCDAFGSYGALDGAIFDDELDMDAVEEETRRYYATIVGRFSCNVQSALKKASPLPIKMICPSHGPIHRGDVARVINLYDRLSRQETEKGAVIVYGSMYGHTAYMAECFAEGLLHCGLKTVKVYDASIADLSCVIRDIWRYKGLALFSCCYNAGMFPAMHPVVEKIENSKVSGRVLALGGCYTWSKGAELKKLVELGKQPCWDLIDPIIEIKSSATDADRKALFEAGCAMARKILGSTDAECPCVEEQA
ncbi:MAG: FprA family A-type flavoprotein [Pyramidobacter sp.]|nr:FprA family A-type flavoprotein [Pyramidobacter sp.]